MQIVYALVSNGWDQYAQMAYLSASSLKRVHPDARTVLVTDEATAGSLAAHWEKLHECFDELRPVSVPGGTPMFRSRTIKTTLRQMISGDYIFLDADTLVIRSLDPLWTNPADLAMALEQNSTLDDQRPPYYTRGVYETMSWPFPPAAYVNSGVMLVRDTPRVHKLFATWHALWREQIGKSDRTEDQESLAHALQSLGIMPTLLSRDDNLLILVHPRITRSVRIVHFQATAVWSPDSFVFTHLLRQVAANQPIDWGVLDRCLREEHPWVAVEPWLLMRSGHKFRAFWLKLLGLLRLRRRAANPAGGTLSNDGAVAG